MNCKFRISCISWEPWSIGLSCSSFQGCWREGPSQCDCNSFADNLLFVSGSFEYLLHTLGVPVFRRMCLGLNLFSFILLGTWWVLSTWTFMHSFSTWGCYSIICIIHIFYIFFPRILSKWTHNVDWSDMPHIFSLIFLCLFAIHCEGFPEL